jgi:hypothetical protein
MLVSIVCCCTNAFALSSWDDDYGKLRVDGLVFNYRVKPRRQKEIKPFQHSCHILHLYYGIFSQIATMIYLRRSRNIRNIINDIIAAASVTLRNNSVCSLYPPILCIRFRVGLNSLARILLIIPSGFFFIHSRIYVVI